MFSRINNNANRIQRLAIGLGFALLAMGDLAWAEQTLAEPLLPEADSGSRFKPGWQTGQFAVASANPLASEAGYQILKAGGSAVDAAIAVQMVLGLVEPQSSGIGGGAFLLHFDGKKTQAFDGRETAPSAVDEKLFIGADGRPLPFQTALVGGRAVGVPGLMPMLAQAHRQHGKLPWTALFAPAIQLAEQGFAVSERLHTLITKDAHLAKDPVAAAYFYLPDGKPLPVGHTLKNPEYAAVLRQIAAQGEAGFMQGDTARAMVATVQGHTRNPGQLSVDDLARYQAKERPPLCVDHTTANKIYQICGIPPPSSGAIAIAQILGMLDQTPAKSHPFDGTPSVEWLHLYTEAARLAFADRALYVADPDFVAAPGGDWLRLLNKPYLAERAQLIGPRANPSPPAGTPGTIKTSFAPMPDQTEYGTSHISIADAQGHVLAMTSSIEAAFGARLMVNRGQGLAGGFLLNNQLTDFSFSPADANGTPIANRVQPGKRPRSSMSPTLVFDKATGQVLMSLGSSGGAFIIHFTAKTLYALMHWGLNAQQAINLPNFGLSERRAVLLETGRFDVSTVQALQALGHTLTQQPLTSGLQAIQRTPQGWFGGADPRREGIVLGD